MTTSTESISAEQTSAESIPTGIGNAMLAEEGVDFIIRNLSTMYTDPLYAVLREWVANAVDSVTTAHARGEIDSLRETIHITLPDETSPMITITDYGLGMDRSHVFNYALNYGRSSKRGDTATAGKFGLGLKSGLAVANQFTITSVRDGKQTMGFLSLGDADSGVENFCSEPQDTELDNQTTLSVAIADENSITDVYIKITHVLGGYDPAMFVVTSPSEKYSIDHDKLRGTYLFDAACINLGGVVYNMPSLYYDFGGWSVTAVVGGVSYPIRNQLFTHEVQINEAIAEKLAAYGYTQQFDFHALKSHSIVLPIDGVDIPDNRDTLIFSQTTIDTIADTYVAAIIDAHEKAAEYFEQVSITQAQYDSQNFHTRDDDFKILYHFAPQWYRKAELSRRVNDVLRSRYGDDVHDLWDNIDARRVIARHLENYAVLRNNDAYSPNVGFDVHPLLLRNNGGPDSNMLDPGTTMFITLDVSDRKEEITQKYITGEEYTTEVYVDDKGEKHRTADKCIRALLTQYRIRINTWRRENDLSEAYIGPDPEAYVWEARDFTEVIDFDAFIERCTVAHRAHVKAQRKAKQAQDKLAPSEPHAIAHFGTFYHRDGVSGMYHRSNDHHDNITIEQLEAFAATHNVTPQQLPIVIRTTGKWQKLKDMVSSLSFHTPAVEPVVVFLRTTKKQIRELENAGFTNIFDKDEFVKHCFNRDYALRDQYFASLSDTQRKDVSHFIWAAQHAPLLGYAINVSSMHNAYFFSNSEYEDVLAVVKEQFADRDVDITNNAGYVFLHELIASVKRGHKLLHAQLSNEVEAYLNLDQDDTDTWSFSGRIVDVEKYKQQPATIEQPFEHAICGMLQARSTKEAENAPYVGLYTTDEYVEIYEQGRQKKWDKGPNTLSPIERVLCLDGSAQFYDLVVRICQLDW